MTAPERYVRTRRAVRWALLHRVPHTLLARAARKGDTAAGVVMGVGPRKFAVPTPEVVRAQGRLVCGRFMCVTASFEVARDVLRREEFGVGDSLSAYTRPARALLEWARSPAAMTPADRPSMLVLDPPELTRFRRLVSSVFTPRAVEGLHARIEEIATGLLEEMKPGAAGPDASMELVSAYADVLPATVIAEILGMPVEERHLLLGFAKAIGPSMEKGMAWRDYRTSDLGARAFNAWLSGHLERLRRQPGDNLLSRLVAAEDEGGPLSDIELRSVAGLVLGAGFVTAADLIGTGALLLMRHPDQLAALQEHPAHWSNAVEEILRLETPVQMTARSALRDTEVDGVGLREGTRVIVLLAGANRDPEIFPQPDRFDVQRANARDHLAFSAGRHFCLGAGLARAEAAIGLRLLFQRYPDLTLASTAERRRSRMLVGWERMPVTTGGAGLAAR